MRSDGVNIFTHALSILTTSNRIIDHQSPCVCVIPTSHRNVPPEEPQTADRNETRGQRCRTSCKGSEVCVPPNAMRCGEETHRGTSNNNMPAAGRAAAGGENNPMRHICASEERRWEKWSDATPDHKKRKLFGSAWLMEICEYAKGL